MATSVYIKPGSDRISQWLKNGLFPYKLKKWVYLGDRLGLNSIKTTTVFSVEAVRCNIALKNRKSGARGLKMQAKFSHAPFQ